MTYQTRENLAAIDLFRGLSRETMEELEQAGTIHTFPPGAVVFEQGRGGPGLEVVLSGTAEVSVNDVPRRSVAEGEYFGEVSLIDGLPKSASVTAGSEGLTTFTLSALAFAPMLDRPEVSRALLVALCEKLRRIEAS